MPTCLAYGCSNTTGRVKNKCFYKIPDPKKERQRAVRWLHNMGNSKVCQLEDRLTSLCNIAYTERPEKSAILEKYEMVKQFKK